ncbi:MAG TPA: hypothetical protein VMT28_02835 [Terriglobales bacterium]|jgi:hypothetical protein|nr:hypothetical protein [Terriglobales bacterium]
MQIDSALWIAQPVLQFATATTLFARRLQRRFPVFFAYLIWQILVFGLLFPIRRWGSYSEYFYAFWIADAITLALGFKIIHEIFLDVFRPYHALKDLGSVLFNWAALVMILVASVVAAASPATSQGPLVQAVFTVQRCVRAMQCGLILFLLVFSRYLGVSWRQQSFGIALGFGGFAIVDLGLIALNAAGRVGPSRVDLTNAVAYSCAILVWLGYALLPGVCRDASANLLRSQRWDEGLSDVQHPLPADSLIPMFEGMVDRAFSRTNGGPARSQPEAESEVAAAAAAGVGATGSAPGKSPAHSPRGPNS